MHKSRKIYSYEKWLISKGISYGTTLFHGIEKLEKEIIGELTKALKETLPEALLDYQEYLTKRRKFKISHLGLSHIFVLDESVIIPVKGPSPFASLFIDWGLVEYPDIDRFELSYPNLYKMIKSLLEQKRTHQEEVRKIHELLDPVTTTARLLTFLPEVRDYHLFHKKEGMNGAIVDEKTKKIITDNMDKIREMLYKEEAAEE